MKYIKCDYYNIAVSKVFQKKKNKVLSLSLFFFFLVRHSTNDMRETVVFRRAVPSLGNMDRQVPPRCCFVVVVALFVFL